MKLYVLVFLFVQVLSGDALSQSTVLGIPSARDHVVVRIPGMTGGHRQSVECTSVTPGFRVHSCTLICPKSGSPLVECRVEVGGAVQQDRQSSESIQPFSPPPFRSSLDRK